MVEIIEPNPTLIEYVKISNSLWAGFDNLTTLFTKSDQLFQDEWHYIMSNLEQNIFLLKRLQERNLLKSEINICDAGIGLGSALFDIYLQSKELSDIKFNFFGIEKQAKYIDFFNQNLKSYWNDELNFIEGDIIEQDFSNYDIVYSYSPYVQEYDLYQFYDKVKSEIKSGSLLIENRENGLGLNSVLTRIDDLEKIEIDDIYVFRKI